MAQMGSSTKNMKQVEIKTRDGGMMEAYFAQPQREIAGGVVILQEIFGVNNAMRLACDDFADQGYLALAPELFWRLDRGIEHPYTDSGRAGAFAHWHAFDQELGIKDLLDAGEFLKGHKACNGKIAFVGFCLGGQLGMLAAARTDVDAVISFYGVRPLEYMELFGTLSCPLQFHVGDNDHHVPMGVIKQIQATAADKADADVFVYEGAAHGFFNKVRVGEAYHLEAAKLANDRVLELLTRVL